MARHEMDGYPDPYGKDARKPTPGQLEVEMGLAVVHLEKALAGLEKFHPVYAKKIRGFVTHLDEVRGKIYGK